MFSLSNSGLDPDDMMDFLEEDSYAIADTPNRRPMVIPDTPNHRPMVISDSPSRRPMVMSDISNPRPMVNSKLLRKYVGRRVTTVVKVLRVEGGSLVGELPDGAPITVHRAPQHVAAQSMFVEVIGVVESNRSLRAQTCTGFGDDFGHVLDYMARTHYQHLSARLEGKHSLDYCFLKTASCVQTSLRITSYYAYSQTRRIVSASRHIKSGYVGTLWFGWLMRGKLMCTSILLLCHRPPEIHGL